MALIVGSARHDENGKISGGKAGDQTGSEVATQAYYMHNKGWYCFRPKDVNIADKIAKAMTDACNNNHIGYDQGQRTDVITALKKYGKMVNIAENTEADCSSLIRGCCIEAGFDPGNFNTDTEKTALANTGKFMEKISVTSSTVLYNGDVLVTKTKGHTVAVVSGRPRQATQSVPTSSPTAQSSVGITVKNGSAKPESAKYKNASFTGSYKVIASDGLNMRTGAGTNKTIIGTLAKDTVVKCYGYYSQTFDGTKWYYVAIGKYTGYVSSKFLTKIS